MLCGILMFAGPLNNKFLKLSLLDGVDTQYAYPLCICQTPKLSGVKGHVREVPGI